AERSQQPRQQGGAFAPAVVRAGRDVQRAPPQPIAAALVAQLPTVPASAVQLAGGVTRVRDRSGTCVDEDSGAGAERRGESDLAIREHAYLSGDPRVDQCGLELRLLLRTSGAGGTHDRSLRSEERRVGTECKWWWWTWRE